MKAVVAEINFFDNEIKQYVVEVETKNWKEAYFAVLKQQNCSDQDEDFTAWLDGMPKDLDEARREFVNGEMDITIVWID